MKQRIKARVGSVPYLNAKPLFYPLLSKPSPAFTLHFDVPRRLSEDLGGGLLQGALCPALQAAMGDFEVLSSYGIVSRGAVGSVHLYARKDPEDWKSVRLDQASVSSAALVEVLCRKYFKNGATMLSGPPGKFQEEVDAYLLIGDPDMKHRPAEGVMRWDLGEAWQKMTGLPFLYAAWIVRPDMNSELKEVLNGSFLSPEDGRFEKMLEEDARNMDLEKAFLKRYLKENIHFHIDKEVIAGFETFVAHVAEIRKMKMVPLRWV
jgi:chorismate dehydratase